ncbi:MAG: DUF423 domain-containing protein, partial [Eudoraea sp.]|nr:DUF423 domain-containing protein [Eudoraea sp.]
MNKTIFCTGVFFAALAVLLGAFAAHGLEKLVSASAQDTFQTGVTYQMYHALLLLVVGSVKSIPEEQKKLVYYFIVAGIVFFSFSIYMLATNDLTGFDFRTIGIITPIGGLL